MPHRARRPTAPDWWPTPSTSSSDLPPDLSLTLGRLLERSEHMVRAVDRIGDRLEDGDARMDGFGEQISDLHATVAALGERVATPKPEPVPAAERLTKDLARWLIPLGAAWWSGAPEAVLKVALAMAGAK